MFVAKTVFLEYCAGHLIKIFIGNRFTIRHVWNPLSVNELAGMLVTIYLNCHTGVTRLYKVVLLAIQVHRWFGGRDTFVSPALPVSTYPLICHSGQVNMERCLANDGKQSVEELGSVRDVCFVVSWPSVWKGHTTGFQSRSKGSPLQPC